MARKIKKRTLTRIKKRFTRSQNWILIGSIGVLVGILVVNMSGNFSVDDAAYKPLLSVVAKGESGGNYNAYFGSPANTDIRFTDMTLGEVFLWQTEFVRQGSISNAVGKYQIIQPTLIDVTSKLGITHDTVFNEETQDRIAIALMERRGSLAYVNNDISQEEFAANLAKEWAALPHSGGESYYSGDGVNRARVSEGEVYNAIDLLQKAAKKDD